MTLGTEVLEVWQAVQTKCLELVHIDFAVIVLIHQRKNSINNVVRLLLVLNFVLWKLDHLGLCTLRTLEYDPPWISFANRCGEHHRRLLSLHGPIYRPFASHECLSGG